MRGNLANFEFWELGNSEFGNLGDWEFGKLGNWEIGKFGDWNIWKISKVKGFKTHSCNIHTHLFLMFVILISVPIAFTSFTRGWGRLNSFLRKIFSRAWGRCISFVITSASISWVGNQEYEWISLSTNCSLRSTIVGLRVFLSTCLEDAINSRKKAHLYPPLVISKVQDFYLSGSI